MFNLIISLLFMGCFCSSQKDIGYTDIKGALKYYNKLEGTVAAVMDKSDRFHRGISKWEPETIEKRLAELQTSITESADKAGKMGGYQGDTAYNHAVLDLLEFHESLYTEDIPRLLDLWLDNDTTRLNRLKEDYNQRVRNELKELGKKYKRAKFAFMKKYRIPKLREGLGGEMATIERSMDLLDQHGYQPDSRRIRKIRDKFNDIESKRKQ